MKNMLIKELKLSASPLSFLFILFGILTACPGYPILVGGFFVCLGIFQSFLASREANDIVYSALLPVKKVNTVKSKYIFCIFIELCAFLLSAIITLLRMTVFVNFAVYRNNALMNANFVYLGFLALIFGLFNSVFVCGFFKTAYTVSKPFIFFIITAFLVITVGEALHYIPCFSAVNSFGFENMGLQSVFLLVGVILYLLLTFVFEKRAEKYFEKIDL